MIFFKTFLFRNFFTFNIKYIKHNIAVYIVIIVWVNISPIVPSAIEKVSFSSFNKLYKPLNTIGINIKEVSSAKAFLTYISVTLYGASIYNIAAIVAILSFFVTFFVNLYIAKPDKYTTTAMNIFIQFVNDRLNILNISGAYAVNGL